MMYARRREVSKYFNVCTVATPILPYHDTRLEVNQS